MGESGKTRVNSLTIGWMAPAPAARGPMLRFLFLFPVCLLLGFGLLLAPFSAPASNAFTTGLASFCAAIIRLFGGQALAYGNLLRHPLNGFGISIEYGCNGANVTVLLWAAMLTFPATWTQKAKGLAAGTLAIHGMNVVRLISLYYLGQYNQGWFEFAHLYLWESLLVLDTLVVFWVWAGIVQRGRGAASGG